MRKCILFLKMDMCCSTRSSRHFRQEILTVMCATYLHTCVEAACSLIAGRYSPEGIQWMEYAASHWSFGYNLPQGQVWQLTCLWGSKLRFIILLGLPNLSAFKCRKKLLKVIISNLVFTRRWVNNIVSKLQGLANLKWSLPHKVVAAWMRICSSYFSWVLTDIIAKSSHCFWKCDRKSKCEFHYSCSAYIFSRLICPYLHPLLWVDEVSG
jgi:hypothetical protein